MNMMNRYKITFIEFAQPRTVIVSSIDPQNAIFAAGIADQRSVIKLELLEASDVEDLS